MSRGVLVLSCPVSVDFPCCVPQSASQIGSPGHLKVLTLTLALHFLRHLGNICTKGDPEEEVLQERIGGPGIRLERHESDKAERSASPLCPPARQPVQGRALKGKVLAILRGKGPREGTVASRMTRHGPSSSAGPVGSSLNLPGRHHPPRGGGPSGLRIPTPACQCLGPHAV